MLSNAWKRYKRVVGSVERTVSSALGGLGAAVCARPVLVLVASLVVSITFTILVPFRVGDLTEDRSEKLWCVPGLRLACIASVTFGSRSPHTKLMAHWSAQWPSRLHWSTAPSSKPQCHSCRMSLIVMMTMMRC